MLHLSFVFVVLLFITKISLGQLPESCSVITSRTEWNAQKPREVLYAIIPSNYVIVHDTESKSCNSKTECLTYVYELQNYHRNTRNGTDIKFSFMIGGDGRVYEGTGWHKEGEHTKDYNKVSYGIAFIGNFTNEAPSPAQVAAAKSLLTCGIQLGQLAKDYKLKGACQVISKRNPGLKLYKEIQTWSNYVPSPPSKRRIELLICGN